MIPALPRASGVYQIRCVPTGKIYVGSTVNLRERWNRHRWSLNRGRHRNPHLQQAWIKYGEANFEFSILEFVERDQLLAAEQIWINKTGCANRTLGFNAYDVAGSPGEARARAWEGFVDPNGNEVTIKNLHAFCQKQGLTFRVVSE